MIYSIHQSTQAELDLDGITNYIIVSLNNPNAAGDLLDLYKKKLETLRITPRLYGLSQIISFARMGLHRFNFGNYIAYYTINDEEGIVSIVRIVYKRQDYSRVL